MPKYSIIIPVCDNEDLTFNCLQSIRKNTNDYEIIIVDNGSKVPWTGVDRIIRNEENLGYPKACNQGIEAAEGEIIILLNNDTEVTPQWTERLSAHFDKFDVVGPVTNQISGPQKIETIEPFLPEYADDEAKSQYQAEKGKTESWHRLVFFCVAIKKAVIEKIGMLDEQFSPGNYEDDDFCLRAIQAGFRLGIARDVFIYHKGSATHQSLNLDHQKLLNRNAEKFAKKWTIAQQEVLAGINKRYCMPEDIHTHPTIALVMVVKNEEKGLANAILSCRGIVNQVVVAVDDSSTDETLQVANQYADIVKVFKWRDDFAWARNYAHQGVMSDYIIFLDGHEYLRNGEKIKEHLKEGGDGFLCTVELDNDSVIRNPRIYKNGIQFAGKVHELQENLKPKLAVDVVIRHDRIHSQDKKAAFMRDVQRDDQIPRIMGAQIKENPKNGRALFHLALHAQSKRRFKEAIYYQKRFLKTSNTAPERWYMYFNMAFCHLALGHNYRAWIASGNAERETPYRWEVQKLRGMIMMSDSNYKKALTYFVESFSVNNTDVSYKPWGREVDGTWSLIGECFFHLGDYYKAFEAFRQGACVSADPKFKDFLLRRATLMKGMSEHKK